MHDDHGRFVKQKQTNFTGTTHRTFGPASRERRWLCVAETGQFHWGEFEFKSKHPRGDFLVGVLRVM